MGHFFCCGSTGQQVPAFRFAKPGADFLEQRKMSRLIHRSQNENEMDRFSKKIDRFLKVSQRNAEFIDSFFRFGVRNYHIAGHQHVGAQLFAEPDHGVYVS